MRDRRVAAWLALGFWLVYVPFSPGFFRSSDEVGVFETTSALAGRADLVVPDLPHAFTGRAGRNYSIFGVGQSVLALPFYAAGRLADAALPETWRDALAGPERSQGATRYGGSAEIFCVGLYGPVASALLLAVFFLFERRLGASRPSALIAALVLGGATYVAVLSTYFLRHTTEALLVLSAFYLLFAWKVDGGLHRLAWASLLASSLLLLRVPAAASGPALAGYALWTLRVRGAHASAGREPPAAVWTALLAPALCVAAVHVAVNQLKWGTWLISPMLGQSAYFDTPLWLGLAGFLVSPGVSLFVYSPPLVLSPWTLGASWRERRAEWIAVLAIVATALFVCARFQLWHGLWSAPGPRMLFVAIPLLMLPLGPWLDSRAAPLGRAALGTLAGLGVAIQFLVSWVSWPGITAFMGYHAEAPGMGFLWDPARSPVAAFAMLLGRVPSDAWVAQSLREGGDRVVVVTVLAVLWAGMLLLCARGLRRDGSVSAGVG